MRVIKCNKGLSIRGMIIAAVILFMIYIIYPFTELVINNVYDNFGDDDHGVVQRYISNYKTILAAFVGIVFLMLILSAQSSSGGYRE